MKAYRIADGRRPVFDGMGAMLHGGRWNSPGRAVIYAAANYATAMLEVLAHANLSMLPKHHVSIEIEIPDRLRVRSLSLEQIPGWPHPEDAVCRSLGDRWLVQARSVALSVPSMVTGGRERNLLLNPAHPDFKHLRAGAPVAVPWDVPQ